VVLLNSYRTKYRTDELVRIHNSDINKTALMVIKLAEPLLGHSHTPWVDNYNILELACFLKSKERQSIGNRNNVPTLVKAKKNRKRII
jgi:hypothetical protein